VQGHAQVVDVIDAASRDQLEVALQRFEKAVSAQVILDAAQAVVEL